MANFRRLHARLIIAFGALIAVLLGVGWLSLDRMARMDANIQQIVDRRWQNVQLARKALRYSALNSRITIQIFLTEGREELDALLALRAGNTDRISDLLAQIEARSESDEGRKRIAAVWAKRTPYVDGYKEALDILLKERRPEAARAMMAKTVLPRLIAYHEAWEAFVELQGSSMSEAGAAAQRHASIARREVLVLLVVGAFLASGISLFVTRSVAAEAARRERAEQALRESRASAPIGILEYDAGGRALYANPHWQKIVGASAAGNVEGDWLSALHPDDATRVLPEWQRAVGLARVYEAEFRLRRPGGETCWVHFRAAPVRSEAGEDAGYIGTAEDITERKEAEAALAETQEQLILASRHAGMAEVATGVLHNVKNVLNSVGIASTRVAQSLKASRAANLSKIVGLMREHEGDLGAFLTHDPKGKKIPLYLAQLAEVLVADQTEAMKQLADVQKNIEHIREIVTLQQRGAKSSGVVKDVSLADLLEDALRMDPDGEADRGIQIVRQFDDAPTVAIDKHKVLQILVNLLRNAKQACCAAAQAEKCITVRVTHDDNYATISVVDNGIGIAPEVLGRIFAYGYTTKPGGHGFGLHSSMFAAKELGGRLHAHSDGVGRGATFTLELPLRPIS